MVARLRITSLSLQLSSVSQPAMTCILCCLHITSFCQAQFKTSHRCCRLDKAAFPNRICTAIAPLNHCPPFRLLLCCGALTHCLIHNTRDATSQDQRPSHGKCNWSSGGAVAAAVHLWWVNEKWNRNFQPNIELSAFIMSLDSKVQASNWGKKGTGTWPKINGDWKMKGTWSWFIWSLNWFIGYWILFLIYYKLIEYYITEGNM